MSGLCRLSNRGGAPAPVAARIDALEARTLLSDIAWSSGVGLPQGRGDATALPYGADILLLGGRAANGVQSTVYDFSPDQGAWNSAPPIDPGRTAGGGAASGARLVLFGGSVQGRPTSGVLNYDPRPDGDSANGPSMLAARSSFAYSADARTGDLYAIGGLGSANAPIAAAERYDPAADAWAPVAALPRALYGISGASDGFGHVFVFGGAGTLGGAPVSTVYRYTIATDTWDAVAPLPTAERQGTAVAAPDGKIYVIGGLGASGAALASVQSYNPATNSWAQETPLPAPLYGAAVTTDLQDNLYVIGGFNSAGTPLASVITAPITPGLLVPYTPSLSVDPNYFVYDAAPHAATATVLGVDGVTPVDGTLSFTYNGSPDPPTVAGDYRVVATFTSNDPDYLDTVAAGDLFIDRAAPTLTLTGGGTFRYDGAPHAASATVVGIDHTTPVAGSLAITYNGSASPPVDGGTYKVLATFTSADPNYADATATTTITIPDPTIPTGVTATGASTTSIRLSWDAAPVPVAGYNVYERHVLHDPKGSGSTITYALLAANVQSTSVTIGVPTAFAGSAGHTYYVSSVSPTGVVSARSAPASGLPLYAPSLYGALLGGAVVSSADVRAGQSVQISLLAYGNLRPTFALVSGPADTMVVDPVSGVVTYAPSIAESGDVTATFSASNSVGTATETFTFHVLPAPAVSDVSAASPTVGPITLATAADGLRLLPAGRTTDLPWLGTDTLTISTTVPIALTAADVSVTGASGTNYGPVTLSTTVSGVYQITLARPINSADRVTLRISDPAMVPYVRRIDVLPGDVTDDGRVDFADLLVVARQYGGPGTWISGDLTGDGRVNFDDLLVLARSYNTFLPPG